MKKFQEKPWLVSDGYVKRRIAIEGIAYAEADRMYSTLVFCTNGTNSSLATRQSLACPLGTLEKELPEEMFVRVSRSHIVNVWAVESVRGLSLTMRGGKVIHIGKTYAHQLDERFHVLRATQRGQTPQCYPSGRTVGTDPQCSSEESLDGSEKKSEKRENDLLTSSTKTYPNVALKGNAQVAKL